MVTSLSSLRVFCVSVVVVVLAVVPLSSGVDDRYSTCSSSLFTCGHIKNVGYPFWGDGRPQYCGHPKLQLQCINLLNVIYPYLKIGPDNLSPYYVVNITMSEHNLTLRLHGAPRTPCNSYGEDFGKILQLNKGVEKANVLYKCSKTANLVPERRDAGVSCFDNLTKVDVYYRSNMSAHGEYASCKSATVPVFKSVIDSYGGSNFSRVISEGFEVVYEYPSDCVKCRNSGCICGSSSSSDFVCLCKPGKWKLMLGIAILGAAIIIAVLTVAVWCHKKRKSRSATMMSRMISLGQTTSDLEIGNSFHGIPIFPYSQLHEATNNFDEAQELGDGGFGIVYYGKLRDGREVAVKRLYEKNYKQVGQFMNEVEILTRLRHPNLVTLYGCTSRNSRELLLVYEYVANGTVAEHLHGDRSESGALTWPMRMKIAVETANALLYLHTSDIVHRDVKTTNILLDSSFSVKVADFGLSRLFPIDMTHISTAPQGTPGYLDPEYHKCYQVTNKSDVYSFGVVLVELISSLPAVDIRRHGDEINLSDYAMKRIQRGALHELVDQKLGYNSDFKVKRMITLVAELAFQCLQQEKEFRPCMVEVLEGLTRIDGLDYDALEAEDREEKRVSLTMDGDIEQPPTSPSSVIDSWGMGSSSSNPSA
ncbi:hypothetical protein vseg_007137 [Gypsophila vaccaria]